MMKSLQFDFSKFKKFVFLAMLLLSIFFLEIIFGHGIKNIDFVNNNNVDIISLSDFVSEACYKCQNNSQLIFTI